MNATDKAEALRLLDVMDLAAIGSLSLRDRREYSEASEAIRSLLSTEVSGVVSPDDPWTCPLPEHWRQAFDEVKCNVYDRDWKKIEQRARELARKGVVNAS